MESFVIVIISEFCKYNSESINLIILENMKQKIIKN